MRAIDYLNKHGLEHCKKYLEETGATRHLGSNFWVCDDAGEFHIDALKELVALAEYNTIVQTTTYQRLLSEIKMLKEKDQRQGWIDNPAQGMF